MSRMLPVPAICLFIALSGCKDDSSSQIEAHRPARPAPTEASTSDKAPVVTAKAQALVVQDATGTVAMRLEPKSSGGYRILDAGGRKIGKVSIESDRVKVKDATGSARAKVKRKEDGFKLYAPDDRVVLKGKLKGNEGLKLKTDDGTKIGKLSGSRGTIHDQKVRVTVREGGLDVYRGDAIVAKVDGNLRAEPAVLLALDDLDIYQRAALLVFLKEVF